MPTIAMTGEIGTHGADVAARLSSRLGLRFIDSPELEERLLDRLARRKGSLFGPRPRPVEIQDAFSVPINLWCNLLADEVLELAAYGNVLIRGWGAAALLSRYPYIVRIRTSAARDERIRRLGHVHRRASPEQLRQVIESGDTIEDFYLQWFADGIEKTDLFNLDLDTSAHTPEECVQRIVAYMAAQPIRTPTPPPEMERRQFDG